jgi:hypothetical protein
MVVARCNKILFMNKMAYPKILGEQPVQYVEYPKYLCRNPYRIINNISSNKMYMSE